MALKRTTLVGATVEELLHLIEARQLSAGDSLPSTGEIAEELDVSRTVVREAIAELAGQGLLIRRQGKDTEISFPGHAEFERLLRLRAALVSDDTNQLSQFVQAQLSAAAHLAASQAASHVPSALDAEIRAIESAATADASVDAEQAFFSHLAQLSGNDLFSLTIDGSSALLRPVRLAVWAKWRETSSGIGHIILALRGIQSAIVSGNPKDAASAVSRYCALNTHDAAQPVGISQ